MYKGLKYLTYAGIGLTAFFAISTADIQPAVAQTQNEITAPEKFGIQWQCERKKDTDKSIKDVLVVEGEVCTASLEGALKDGSGQSIYLNIMQTRLYDKRIDRGGTAFIFVLDFPNGPCRDIIGYFDDDTEPRYVDSFYKNQEDNIKRHKACTIRAPVRLLEVRKRIGEILTILKEQYSGNQIVEK